MRLRAYAFFFSEPLTADEVVEVASSPLHHTLRAGIEHNNVVFESSDAVGWLEFRANGLRATLATTSRFARELVEVVEEAAHGKVVLAYDVFKGGCVAAASLPPDFGEINLLSTTKRRVTNLAKRIGVKLPRYEFALLCRVAALEEMESRVTADMFNEQQLITLGELVDRGLVQLDPDGSISLAKQSRTPR